MRFESIPRQSLARAVSELAAKGVRKLLVTSAGSGDGKSSVVAALGSALAIAEQASVALVDADAYKPTLHRAFGLGVEYGLGELLEELYWVDLAHETPAQFGLGDWIELLRAQQRTGELKVSDATQAFTLRFVKGVLGSIAERTAADPYRLGELLVANGRISAVQLEQALVVQFETGRPLGDVLCTLGVVGAADLAPVLHDQYHHRLRRLIGLRQARCQFSESVEPYRAVTCGHDPSLPESGCIDDAITGHVRAYLGDPYLSSQVPGYLRDTSRPNLKILTAGRRASDLLSARHAVPFALLLQRLERVFDVVVVDAPPASLHTPTAALAKAVDGVLLVVRAGRFEAADLRRTIEQLQRAGGRILGVVLTDVVLPAASGISSYYRIPATGRGGSLAGSRP